MVWSAELCNKGHEVLIKVWRKRETGTCEECSDGRVRRGLTRDVAELSLVESSGEGK